MKHSWKVLSLVSLGGVLESCTPLQKDIDIHYLDAFASSAKNRPELVVSSSKLVLFEE